MAGQAGGGAPEMRRTKSGAGNGEIPHRLCGACGRDTSSRTRAASGLRPAGHYGLPARSWLTTGVTLRRKRGPTLKNAVMERREASIPIARDAHASPGVRAVPRRRGNGAPCGAPSPSLFEGEKEGPRTRGADHGAPAPQTTGPAELWLDRMTDDGRQKTERNIVMAGLVPAIHVFDFATILKRGCPRQARA